MKKWMKILCPVLAVLVAASAVTIALTRCKREEEREIIWVNYGESKDIPCLQIPDAEFATTDDFRYILRKANKVGISSDWGYLEKKIRQEDKAIEGRYYGGGVYLTRYVDMTLERYNSFVGDMESQGFAVLAQSSLADNVYTTSLTYKECNYTVTYFAQTKTIDVTASEENHLSPLLQKENASTKDGAVEGFSTTMTTWAHRDNGITYVFQLPNGHYVISGGGVLWDFPNLLAYLEEHAPEGETPVVEAWFIDSGNYDLCNWIMGFVGTDRDLKYFPDLIENPAKDRLAINGLYYNMPGADVIDSTAYTTHEKDGETYYSKTTNSWPTKITQAATCMLTEDGQVTPLYRPMSGQVYYFNGGLTVEVPMSQEQMDLSEYELEFKVSSNGLIFRYGETAFFDMGYMCEKNQDRMVELCGEEYFADVDMLGVSYRGGRMYEKYRDVFTGSLVIYATTKPHQLSGESANVYNHYLEKEGVEVYTYADGTLCYNFTTGEKTVEPAVQERPWR